MLRTRGASGAGYGAIGGAASALLTQQVLGAIDPNHDQLTTAQTAIATAASMLAGGTAAALLGQNANAAATAAANEALNNGTQHWATRLVVCLLCWSPPQNAGSQTDAGGGPMNPTEVYEQAEGKEVNPIPPDPFQQNPPGK